MKSKLSSVKQKKKKYETGIFIRQLYNYLREQGDNVHFKKLHGREGYYDPATDEIAIDYRKEIMSTLIHEVIHYLHPYWSENKVVIKEREIMNAISVRQCKNIMIMMVKYI